MKTARRQPAGVLLAFSLAWSGGYVAYTPFLTLLLPIRFTELAGSADRDWLALSATLGAVAAGSSNILWGWLSDRDRRRKAWFGAGLVMTGFGSVLIWRAATPAEMVTAVVAWQIALNLLLAPLAAYFADSVPDEQKGAFGGLLVLGPAAAALSILGVAIVPPSLGARLALIMSVVALCVGPLLLSRRAEPIAAETRPVEPLVSTTHGLLIALWVVRLVVQVAEGLLFLFVYYLLRERSGGDLSVAGYAVTNAAVQLISVPIALTLGRLSDRTGRRKWPLVTMLATVVLGLVGMAEARSWFLTVAAYALFLTGSNSFLALHSTFAMQKLPNPRHYGRDLGLFNLTNTLPSLTTPLLAVIVIGRFGYSGLLLGLAAIMLIPAAILFRLRLD